MLAHCLYSPPVSSQHIHRYPNQPNPDSNSNCNPSSNSPTFSSTSQPPPPPPLPPSTPSQTLPLPLPLPPPPPLPPALPRLARCRASFEMSSHPATTPQVTTLTLTHTHPPSQYHNDTIITPQATIPHTHTHTLSHNTITIPSSHHTHPLTHTH